MAPTASCSSSDPDQAILSAIQSALQSVIIDGTRHASDLTKFDKILETNAERLRLDPTNKTFQAEQVSKQAIRDECHAQITQVSQRVAQELYGVYRQLAASEPVKAGAKKKTAAQRAAPSNQAQESLAAHAKILDKQLRRNEEEVDRIRVEHRQTIENLQKELAAQGEEIQGIKLFQASTCAAPPPPSIAGDAMLIDDHAHPKEETPSRQTEPGHQPCGLTRAVVREQREMLDLVIAEVADLGAQVLSYLAHVPEHLQQSVQTIRDNVQATLQTTTASHLKQLTELIHSTAADLENRLEALEAVAKRLAPATNTIASSSAQRPLIIRKRSPDTHPSSSLPSPKDPRLICRRSPETKAPAPPEPQNCKQQ